MKRNTRIAYRFPKSILFCLSHCELKFSCRLKSYPATSTRMNPSIIPSKTVSKYIEYNPIYINFRETCTTNESHSNRHICDEIINKNEEGKYVEEDIESVLNVIKNVFLKLGGWYKYDHFIIFI